MDKKKQIEFLNQILEQKIKEFLNNEINYMALQGMIMATGRSQDVLAAETKAKMAKDLLERQIRNCKKVIELVKDNKLEL